MNKTWETSRVFALAHLRKEWAFELGRQVLVWLPLLILTAHLYRVEDLFHSIPSYGDVLELMWGVGWYDAKVRLGQSPYEVYPLLYHPVGWHLGTYAQGATVFLSMLPFYWLSGAAFAYNAVVLQSEIRQHTHPASRCFRGCTAIFCTRLG